MITNSDAASGTGPEEVSHPNQDATTRKSGAQILTEMFARHIVVAKNDEGRPMAARATQPHLFYPLQGSTSTAVAPVLCQYVATHGRPPSRNAVSSALDALTWQAEMSDPVEIHLRAAWLDGVIWIDTGWDDGSVIRVDQSGWDIQTSCPVNFTRSPQTGRMADPRGVEPDLASLKRFVNCDDDDRALLTATLVTAWFDGVPQPVLSLFGGADSGKTTTLRFLLDLVDPSRTQAGGQLDKDVRAIKAMASVRRVVMLDNVSFLDADHSDLLARISTGGELLSRTLYTDDTAHVTVLMRPVWLNGIMNGFTRSDLASRAVSLNLRSITSGQRVAWSELEADWERARPAILAGLLDLMVQVLRHRDHMDGPWDSRLADFQRNLRTIDWLTGSRGEVRLQEQRDDLAESVLDGSSVGSAMREAVACARQGGTAVCGCKDLFDEKHSMADIRRILVWHLGPDDARLPGNNKGLGEALRRVEPDLHRSLGVSMDKSRTNAGRFTVFSDGSK